MAEKFDGGHMVMECINLVLVIKRSLVSTIFHKIKNRDVNTTDGDHNLKS